MKNMLELDNREETKNSKKNNQNLSDIVLEGDTSSNQRMIEIDIAERMRKIGFEGITNAGEAMVFADIARIENAADAIDALAMINYSTVKTSERDISTLWRKIKTNIDIVDYAHISNIAKSNPKEYQQFLSKLQSDFNICTNLKRKTSLEESKILLSLHLTEKIHYLFDTLKEAGYSFYKKEKNNEERTGTYIDENDIKLIEKIVLVGPNFGRIVTHLREGLGYAGIGNNEEQRNYIFELTRILNHHLLDKTSAARGIGNLARSGYTLKETPDKKSGFNEKRLTQMDVNIITGSMTSADSTARIALKTKEEIETIEKRLTTLKQYQNQHSNQAPKQYPSASPKSID